MLHPKFSKMPLRQFWGAVVGAVAGAWGASQANDDDKAAAQKQTEHQIDMTKWQMDYNREMSGTSYQRAVMDMRAAGLNPMLAYSQGGASVPGVTIGSGAKPEVRNVGSAAVAGAAQAQMIENQQDQIVAQTELLKAQRDKTAQETINLGTDSDRIVATTENLKASTKQILAAASELGVREKVHESTIEKALQDVKESYAREDLTRVRATLEKLSIAEARAMEKFFASDIGEQSGFGRAIGSILKAIVGAGRGTR